MKRLNSALLIASTSLTVIACNGEDETNNADNQAENQYPSYCEVTEWECLEFEDGPALTGNRHTHSTYVLDHERVLLIGGFIRDNEGVDRRVDTCEMVNPITNETRIITNGQNDDCFIRTRRDPTIVQLADNSLLAIGGSDADGLRTFRSERFNLETEEWEWVADMPQPAENYQRYSNLNAMLMDDGRVFVLRINGQFGQFNPDLPGGYIYDPADDSWTQLDMPEMEVESLASIMLPDNQVLMVLAEVDDMSKEPLVVEDPELGELLYHQGNPLHLVRYDLDSQTWEDLDTLDERGVGLAPNLQFLPERGWILISIYGDDLRPTLGYLFDPATNFHQQQFSRGGEEMDVPGRAITVLPGDRVLYQSNDFTQYYDLESDQWWQFDAFTPGTYFTSLVQLDDCRLFGSGERAIPSTEEQTFERTGVDSGYCTPVEATE